MSCVCQVLSAYVCVCVPVESVLILRETTTHILNNCYVKIRLRQMLLRQMLY